MGRKNSETSTSASDQSPPRKARRTSFHKSSSSKSSSTAQSALGPVQQSTQSEKRTESTQASGWTSTIALNQSDIQRASISSFATVERSAKPGQYSLHEKKLRNLMPALPPRAPSPGPPEEDIFIDENGRRKIRIPRCYPLASRNDPVSSLADPTTAPPPQQPSNIPTTCSQPLPLQFDPSQCVWLALRDVAFVNDENIKLSMEDLCALLRFRYAGMDARMKEVNEGQVLAMREFIRERGKQMYEPKFPRFIREEMERDLRSMRDAGE